MTQTISQQRKPSFTLNYKKEEEESWDDIEFPASGLFLTNNNEKDYGLSTTTRDMSGITIQDSSDDDSSEGNNYDDSSVESSASSSTSTNNNSSINKVKEMMINRGIVATNNKDEFSGLITRLVGKNNKVVVGDDWDNDMEIPEEGFSNLTITSNNNSGGKRSKSRSSSITITNYNNIINHYEFDSWDEEEEEDYKKIVNENDFITSPRQLVIKRIEDPSKVFSISKDIKGKSVESFDDDFDFSEVDLSRLNLSAETLKLYQESDHEVGGLTDKDPFGSDKLSSRNSSRLSILPSPAPTNSSQSAFESGEEEFFDDLHFPEHMDSLTFSPHLNAKKELALCKNDSSESTVSITSAPLKDSRSSTPLSSKTAEASTRRYPSPITFTKNKVYPKTVNTGGKKSNNGDNNSYRNIHSSSPPVSSLHRLKTNNVFSKRVIKPLPPNNTPQFKAKRSTTINTTDSTNKPTSKKTTNANPNNLHSPSINNKKRFQQNTTFNTTSTLVDSILEIMRKPRRQQSFGDGTELDVFDDLPINLDKEKQDRKNSASSVGSNNDNIQQGRKKKNRKGKKPQLIKNLNLDKNTKAVGEMVYNPITQRWDGNEFVLKDFDNAMASPTRPALITNMNNHSTNTKSLQLVGKMKFDPTKMCWNNDSSEDDEIWDRFDYDSENDSKEKEDDDDCNFNSLQAFSDNDISSSSDSNDFQVGSEFDITPGFLAALLASERQHRNEITRWYPGALSKNNDSRFGLRDITLQRSYLYELRNNKSSSDNNSKISHDRSGGLFEAAMNLTRHERRHFR
ncbi:20440_t:CDS:2 [Funneliformis geosporum]|uniref:6331_t:CDS:1 n=1 Tax=Funneliformis geosporum TaxID=1117311 RepID=A0A9W4SPW4_9GLOM|nr:6331_t:CDS:2 [Funneliformis geosporum]CAI2182436.1 20440_t:CDS:2 [Funneliformis geosporum]